jgi:ABC-type multidrug transport system fused ATPase/permease subunit
MALFMSPSVKAIVRANRWWIGVIVCAALEAALTTFRPFYVQQIIDTATTQGPLLSLVVSFAVVALLVPLCRWGGSVLASQSAWIATNTLRHQSGQAVFAQPLEFFRHHGVGELSERIDADSGQLHELFGETSAQITHTVVLVLFVAYHTWQIDPRICMMLLGYLIVSSVLIAFTQRDNHSAWEEERVADAALYDTIEESFASITDVKAVGATSVLHQRLTPRLATLLHAHRTARMQSQRATIVATIVNAIGWMIAVILGIWHYQYGGSIGDAVAILGYMALIAQPIEQVRGIIQALQQARGVLARIDALLINPTPPITTGSQLPAGALAITLEHVSFRYPTSPHDVLRDITMHIPAGAHVAIMGRTGSGKSTLIRLLSRNETPYTGAIHYHHHALSQISDASLRHRVAVISQEVDIFNASLRDNVTCFATTYHDDAIMAALTTCGLADFLHALPDGLDTRLGDGQRTLSPGEQQLLALARVWLRDPGVILLDEASAHIDPLSEQRMTQAFASLAQHRTVITIAHRLSTVRHADMIVVLADGIIVEQGAPHLLAQQPESHYADLLARDFGATL